MEIRDIEYLLACVEHGHLSRAAAALHVTQPTLSHAIFRIEKDLGKKVLHRPSNKRSPIRLTAAGQLVVERGRRAQQELSSLKHDINELDGMLRGSVKLAGIQSLNLTLLPKVLAQFAQTYPAIEIQLNTHPSELIPERILNGQEDIGILAVSEQQTLYGLQQHDLYQEDFVAIVRKDDPLAKFREINLNLLSQQDLLLVNPRSYSASVILDACAQAGFQAKPKLILESGETLRECVRAGMGMCILPRGYLAAHEKDLVAIGLRNPKPIRQVIAINAQEQTPSKACSSFLNILRQCAKGD